MQLPPWCVSTPECRSLAARQLQDRRGSKRLLAAAKAAGRPGGRGLYRPERAAGQLYNFYLVAAPCTLRKDPVARN
jgi:hypothetical protein